MQSTRRILLFTSVIVFLFSSLAFASDLPSASSDPEQEPLEVESVPDPWLSLESKTMELRATEKTITDVYNILNSGLMSGTTPKLDNIYSNISSNLEFWAGNTRYSIADLQGMTWGLAQDIEGDISILISQGTNLITETQRTNAKLEYVFSAIEDTINIKWYPYSASYSGTSLGFDNHFLSSSRTGRNFKFAYGVTGFVQPTLIRFSFPLSRQVSYGNNINNFSLVSVKSTSDLVNFNSVSIPDYFLQTTIDGLYLYVFNYDFRPGFTYYFEISSVNNSTFLSNGATGAFYIPFDTLDYQIIKTAFYQAKSSDSDKKSLDQLVQISSQLSSLAHSSQSGSEAAEALADYIVSPQKQAAEDASQQVINSTLNNFTGSGSGAAKSSDSNAMKDVSGSIQSGLNAGGSVSGATGVFNSGSDFWGWFTQQNSNYINNPYPAPVVNNTRKSSASGDEIVDFLTPNSNELQDLLRQGGDQR